MGTRHKMSQIVKTYVFALTTTPTHGAYEHVPFTPEGLWVEDREAAGSNPVVPTRKIAGQRLKVSDLFLFSNPIMTGRKHVLTETRCFNRWFARMLLTGD